MFRNRTFKVLSYLILLVVLCAGQVAAAPRNNANKVEEYSSLVFINCAAPTQIPATECDALVALYNSTNGAGWTNNTGWLQTDTPCTWYGVTCSAGHVTELYIVINNLVGTIPATLGNLTNLTKLGLAGNKLTGSIPSQLGNLTQLKWLLLTDNQLTGSIPTELGNLKQLESLWLNSNQLNDSIPTQLGNLTNLTELVLIDNQLTGSIPSQLGNLTNLTGLYLDNNQLTGPIPTQLGNMTNLGMLYLNNNQLTGSIPTQLGNLTNLTILYLYGNQLTGPIPTELGNLINLTELYLCGNQLTGSIPIELGNLTNLTELHLCVNQLTGSIPSELENLTALRSLELQFNQLTGSIPPQLGNLTNLWLLNLSYNQLSGSIPAQLGNLTNLTVLELSDNRLTGSIPAGLGNLTNLSWLALYNNHLTGSIPIQLGSLTNLTTLYLKSNQLTGSIPPQLGNLTNLMRLYLDGNRLSGEFPTSITNLINLTTFTFDCGITSTNQSVIAFVEALVPGWQNSTCPVVLSITRGGPNPTSAASVNFMVTFSKSVTGVNAGDFSLGTSEIIDPSVASVSGSGTAYMVTVNTGTLDNSSVNLININTTTLAELDTLPNIGPTIAQRIIDYRTLNRPFLVIQDIMNVSSIGPATFESIKDLITVGGSFLRLDVLNNGSIKDLALNPLGAGFTSGEIYTVIKSPTFADVPNTYWANSYIERLYNAGITGGCTTSPLNYCPDSVVTRAQKAVFLVKSVQGASYTPPAVGSSTGFIDVETYYWAAAWIKQLAAEGITGGCGSGNYCSEATVTRAQMAVFLLKAKHGSSYSPPAATGIFTDVPIGYWADKWIEQLASEGITGGCGTSIYCPDSSVTRAQMAVFLVKAFNLP